MRGFSTEPGQGAIGDALGCESDSEITLGSESEDHEWFAHAAWSLLGKEPGHALHLITGYPISSCSAYVAKNADKRRRPPEHFLRKLFQSRQGKPFWLAFMAGCTAPWWRDMQRAARIGEHVIEITKRE